MQLDGIAAIVTGGASGLGASTVQMLAARGAKVAVFERQRATRSRTGAGNWRPFLQSQR